MSYQTMERSSALVASCPLVILSLRKNMVLEPGVACLPSTCRIISTQLGFRPQSIVMWAATYGDDEMIAIPGQSSCEPRPGDVELGE